MTDREPHILKPAAKVRRHTRYLGLALLCAVTVAAQTPAANALEIFGWKIFEPEDPDADITDPLNYTVTLTLSEPDEDLQKILERASSLVQDVKRPVSGSLGLLAKARSDREQLVAALYAEARFDGVVNIEIAGRPLDDIPPDTEFDRTTPVPVTIVVTPGLVFTLGDVALKGDAAGLAPARFGLIAGGNASSSAVLRAEASVVRALKDEGRPLAAVTGREVVADHATTTLDVTLTVAAGPIAGSDQRRSRASCRWTRISPAT